MPRIVRGLDYYCRTAFEVLADGLGAQNAVGGRRPVRRPRRGARRPGGRGHRLRDRPRSPGDDRGRGAAAPAPLAVILPLDERAVAPAPGPRHAPPAMPACASGSRRAGAASRRSCGAADRQHATLALILGEDGAERGARHRARPREARGSTPRRRPRRAGVRARSPGATVERRWHDVEAWQRTSLAGALREADVGREVVLNGWVHGRRDHGGVIFIDLRDRAGIMQVVLDPDESAAAHAAAGDLRLEFVVAVRGLVAPRTPDTVNPQICPPAASRSWPASSCVLNAARPTPFPVDDQVEVTEATRLRYRYLDLRRPRMQQKLRLRHDVARRGARAPERARASSRSRRPILTRSHARRRARLPGAEPRAAAATSTRCRSRRSSSSRS